MNGGGTYLLHFFVENIDGGGTAVSHYDGSVSVRDQYRFTPAIIVCLPHFDYSKAVSATILESSVVCRLGSETEGWHAAAAPATAS